AAASCPSCYVARGGPQRTRPSFPTRRSSDLASQASIVDHTGQNLSPAGQVEPKRIRVPRRPPIQTCRPCTYKCHKMAHRRPRDRSEEHTSELQSRFDLVCRLLLEKKKIHLQP